MRTKIFQKLCTIVNMRDKQLHGLYLCLEKGSVEYLSIFVPAVILVVQWS